GSEGEADLEAEIDVGGGEDDGDQRPEDDPADRELLDVLAGAKGLFSCHLFPLEIVAGARWSGSRVAADGEPAVALLHPYVGQEDAILDRPSEIFEPPARMDRADHHIVELGRILDVEFDRLDVAPLDRIEPVVAMHQERPRRARADEHEIRMHEAAQAIHVLAAQGIAPLALEPGNDLPIIRHAFSLPLPSLRPNAENANPVAERSSGLPAGDRDGDVELGIVPALDQQEHTLAPGFPRRLDAGDHLRRAVHRLVVDRHDEVAAL